MLSSIICISAVRNTDTRFVSIACYNEATLLHRKIYSTHSPLQHTLYCTWSWKQKTRSFTKYILDPDPPNFLSGTECIELTNLLGLGFQIHPAGEA